MSAVEQAATPLRAYPLRRRIPTLRPLATVLAALLGAPVALLLPLGLTVAAGILADRLLGLGGGAAVVLAPLGIGLTAYSFHLFGTLLERTVKLTTPWGELAAGTDGVRWDGWLRRRFLSWGSVQEVLPRPGAVLLKSSQGAVIRLDVSNPDEVLRVFEAARAAHANADREEVPAELSSAGDLEGWIRKARELTDGNYRSGTSSDVLVRVLEDPTAAPLARAGAAVALQHAGMHAQRVRVTREETADEELRVAFDAAMDGKIDAAHLKPLARREARSS